MIGAMSLIYQHQTRVLIQFNANLGILPALEKTQKERKKSAIFSKS